MTAAADRDVAALAAIAGDHAVAVPGEAAESSAKDEDGDWELIDGAEVENGYVFIGHDVHAKLMKV